MYGVECSRTYLSIAPRLPKQGEPMASTMTSPAPAVEPSETTATDELIPNDLVRSAAPSPAGPADDGDLGLPEPPSVPLPRAIQVMHINWRQLEFMFRWQRRLGDVFAANGIV